jgi:hypothetical protein
LAGNSDFDGGISPKIFAAAGKLGVPRVTGRPFGQTSSTTQSGFAVFSG